MEKIFFTNFSFHFSVGSAAVLNISGVFSTFSDFFFRLLSAFQPKPLLSKKRMRNIFTAKLFLWYDDLIQGKKRPDGHKYHGRGCAHGMMTLFKAENGRMAINAMGVAVHMV